jgi:hypothetical protein
MSTAYVSGRVPARHERLVSKQARVARTSKSDLVARYVIEKSLETEFPGVSFRDSLSGREAYLTGHRVASGRYWRCTPRPSPSRGPPHISVGHGCS